MKSSIAESIKSLPPLPKTIADINKIYADEEAGVAELAKVIEQDPMIVANLLKVANSPLYGFGREIKSVLQAVSLFGMSMTRSIALGNAIRKLLNVDMQPYGVSSEEFAEISKMQATLMNKWYKQIDEEKAQKLYLAAFLQETGKILIASDVIKEDESISFASEIEMTNNIAAVEKSYVGISSAELTALIFQHWGFEDDFVGMIRYSDAPQEAPEEFLEFAQALHIVKTAIPVNKPLFEHSVNFALRKARDAGYEYEILEDGIDAMLEHMEEAKFE
jgi:HD-like signal output (HDOD) protein